MVCKGCNKEFSKNVIFCPFCGLKVDKSEISSEPIVLTKETKGPWRVFSIIGFVLGIISLAFSWIPGTGIVFSTAFGVNGIILSTMGKNANKLHLYSVWGLWLSIFSIPISIISFIISIVVN